MLVVLRTTMMLIDIIVVSVATTLALTFCIFRLLFIAIVVAIISSLFEAAIKWFEVFGRRIRTTLSPSVFVVGMKWALLIPLRTTTATFSTIFYHCFCCAYLGRAAFCYLCEDDRRRRRHRVCYACYPWRREGPSCFHCREASGST